MFSEKLESARLEYRRWDVSDSEKVLEIYRKPEVYQHLGNPGVPMKDLEGKMGL